ncbi:Rrf2 family transcriptional regulator [Selenomonas sp. TAMA-11512]|uniref:RrF2 family transcriptional regulator n=1 Tax=Selenomonas sp. TAMA-11512 TaxID=3095337 RepID=UPI00308950D5|nr:Rrf2 family transcriptional regulator [Selenomonas sp. TAMA-11512]
MKISAKGRYGLAAISYLAKHYMSESPTTILSISEELSISKIYLEQVFSLLKRAKLVTSSKGAQGGYQLAVSPHTLTAYDVLSAIELSLMEKVTPSADHATELDQALITAVYNPLDDAIRDALKKVTIEDILSEEERLKSDDNFMYFI